MSEKKYPIGIEPNTSAHQDIIVKVCKAHGVKSLELTTKHIALMSDCICEYMAQQPKTIAVWVKCSDRLPGYETPVKWRDGEDHSHVTDGKIPLIHMAKPFLTGWEWFDEGTAAAGREEDIALYETRLALRMMLKVFRLDQISKEQEKYYSQAEGILKKHGRVTDCLRTVALDQPGREEDAVEFAEWCANNYQWEYDPTSDEYKWLEADNFYTTTELYGIFKQQKEK